jgi:hypothetical protein
LRGPRANCAATARHVLGAVGPGRRPKEYQFKPGQSGKASDERGRRFSFPVVLVRTIRVEEDLVEQLFNSSEKRLARLLLLLANFGKEGRPEPIIAKISQETLAEMIGTTRSRVSFFMNKFRRLGFVDYNGSGLEVHSSLLNVVLHD